jgi:PEGA domain
MGSAAPHVMNTLVDEFADGFGVRLRTVDPTGQEPLEFLRFGSALVGSQSFEFMLRERVGRLANFRHGYYSRVRRVDRVDGGTTLALVSETPQGSRLSRILEVASASGLELDINAALCLVRQLVPAVAMLHQNARDVSHGAIAPERIVITPNARVVIVEYVLGAAVEQLGYNRERLWKELRVAAPSSAGAPRINHRTDVMQLGMVALALVVGRPLEDDDLRYVGDLVTSATESSSGGREPISEPLRRWLSRSLQLDSRASFESALEAQLALDDVLNGESGYIAAPVALETFLARYEDRAVAMAASVVAAAAAAQASAAALTVARNLAEEEAIAARAEAERLEQDRMAVAKAEAERVERENAAARAEAEKAERDRVEREKAEREQADREKAEREKVDREKADREKAAERERVERAERERALAARLAGERAEQEKPAVGGPQVEVSPLAASTVDRPRSKSGSRQAFTSPPAAIAPAASDEPETASEDEALRALFSEPQQPVAKGVPTYWRHVALGLAVLCLAEGALIGVKYRQSLSVLPSSDGTVRVDSKPVGAQVKIDGQPKGATPLSVQVSAGTHVMELSVGGEPRVIPITVTSGETLGQYVELAGVPATGRLGVSSMPSGAAILIDGQPKGVTPAELPDLAVGDHELILDLNGARARQPVTIAAGTLTKVEVRLGQGAPGANGANGAPGAPGAANPVAAVPTTGSLQVKVPFEMQVFEGTTLVGVTSNKLPLPPGPHDLRIVSETLEFEAPLHAEIVVGKTTRLPVALPKGSISLNATPWAEVWIDGEKVGETPIGNYAVTIGPHEVVFKNPDLGEQHHAATVTAATPVKLSVDLTKPQQ